MDHHTRDGAPELVCHIQSPRKSVLAILLLFLRPCAFCRVIAPFHDCSFPIVLPARLACYRRIFSDSHTCAMDIPSDGSRHSKSCIAPSRDEGYLSFHTVGTYRIVLPTSLLPFRNHPAVPPFHSRCLPPGSRVIEGRFRAFSRGAAGMCATWSTARDRARPPPCFVHR